MGVVNQGNNYTEELGGWKPKVNDWVVITKSGRNWAEGSMDKHVGKCIQVKEVSGTKIRFDGSEPYVWQYDYGHFREALLHEIPSIKLTNYSIC